MITRLPTGDDRELELWKCNRYYDRLDDTDEASPWELHNLTIDPEERANRASDTDALTVFGQLRTVLDDTRAEMRRVPPARQLTRLRSGPRARPNRSVRSVGAPQLRAPEEAIVPRYLIIGSYTAQGEEGLLAKGGTARRASVTEMVEKLGGRVETFDYAFGEDDVFVTCELPDNVTAAAIGLAVGASGLVAIRTVVLLTPEEIDDAAAKHAEYHGPGQ